jgi:hypothetical protein
MKREPRLTKRQRKEVARWQAYVADRKRRLEEAAERARVVQAENKKLAAAFDRYWETQGL